MKLTEKLTLLMNERGLNRKEFSQQSGIPYMTIVNFYEKGTENVKLSTLKKISSFFGVSLDYIADDTVIKRTPISTMNLTLSVNETAHIKKYRVLDEHGKEIVDTNLEIEYKRMQQLAKPKLTEINLLSDPPEEEAHIIYLPEPLQPASAGTGDFADDDTAEEVPVLYNTSTAKADYIMRVHGDSMKPDIQDGDRLLVRRQPSVNVGETGIFIHEGERFVKIFQGDCLKSANTDYKDIPVSEYTICIGKVIDVLDPDWIVK